MKKKVMIFSNSCWNIYNFREAIIKTLRDNNYEIICICKKDRYEQKLAEAVDKLILMNLNPASLFLLNDMKFIILSFFSIWREKPDFILSFTVKNNIYAGLLSRILKVKFFPTVSGVGSGVINKNSFIRLSVLTLYKVSLLKSKKVFFHNESDRKLFREFNIVYEENSTVVAGSGVDTEKYVPFRNVGKISRNKTNFYFIGRLIKDKGILEFLNAAQKILKTTDNSVFYVVGTLDSANPSSIARSLLQQYVQPGKIEYLGESDDIIYQLNNADFVVLPSYREGLSKALLEAASMSIPMIASDVPGCREIVLDEVTGFLCRPKDVDSLVFAMEKAISLSSRDRTKMGENAREKIISEFSNKQVADEYLQCLQSM